MQERELSEEELIPEEDPWWRGPLRYILGLFLILLLVVWFFPSQAIKVDPEPRYIPIIEEVVPDTLELSRPNITLDSRSDYLKYIQPNDPQIKQIADKIVALSCEGNRICYAKAIYYFVRDNFQYVSDPAAYEYVKTARESLSVQGGDCDDASVLAANLLQAIGIPTRFVFIPGHVYIQAYLPDAPRRYKSEGADVVSLDLTCSNCDFGELPYSDFVDNKVVVG